jgi:hypothetical protein
LAVFAAVADVDMAGATPVVVGLSTEAEGVVLSTTKLGIAVDGADRALQVVEVVVVVATRMTPVSLRTRTRTGVSQPLLLFSLPSRNAPIAISR